MNQMTNFFIDFLKTEFPDAPEGEAWEYFCESNYAKQIEVIELYAQDAFDAAYKKGVENKHWGQQDFSRSKFIDWKNEQQ